MCAIVSRCGYIISIAISFYVTKYHIDIFQYYILLYIVVLITQFGGVNYFRA
jgi:hypothetical protein